LTITTEFGSPFASSCPRQCAGQSAENAAVFVADSDHLDFV
jgi:hypothetical protein